MARKTVTRYVPERGDIVWTDFAPTRGHEQSGKRPAVVVSASSFNRATGMAFIVPITSRTHGYQIEVPIQASHIQGYAIVSQIRSVDWGHRLCTYADQCPREAFRSIQGMLVAFITG